MKIRMILVLSSFASIMACNGGNSTSNTSGSGLLSSFPDANNPATTGSSTLSSNLRISLTDAPSRELKSVFVNVDHAELFVKKGSSHGRVLVAQNLGMVDLMKLRNGVLLPMEDITLSPDTEVTAIRLVLRGDNNHSIKSDDSRCEMQTPSGQQSGIKIHLNQPFKISEDHKYSMVLDFDAEKSVVIKGNGGCLLKPVLKLMHVTRCSKKYQIPNDTGSTPDNSTETGSDDSTNGSSDGTDQNTVTDPEVVTDPVVVIQPVTDGTDTNPGSDFEIPMDPADEPAIIPAL